MTDPLETAPAEPDTEAVAALAVVLVVLGRPRNHPDRWGPVTPTEAIDVFTEAEREAEREHERRTRGPEWEAWEGWGP